MAQLQTVVGVQNNQDSATPTTARGGHQGEVLVSELQPRYYVQNYYKNKFYGSNGAVPSVTTVALATAYTGLCIYNPSGSNTNLILTKVGYSFLVAFPAASTIGLMVGWAATGVTTASAAASPGACSLIGGSPSTPNGKVALSATLVGTPTLHTIFGEGLTGAITTVPESMNIVDLEGSVILAPGAYAAIYTSTISGAASLAASFEWIEAPL